MSYTDDIKLNKNNLDEEWEKQSERVFYYGEKHAFAITKRDDLKEKLKIYSSDLELRIRENPENYDLVKVTEAAVNATISQDASIKSYNKEIIALNEEVNVLAVAMKAFEHKRSALEGLTKLYLNHYYSEQPTDSDIKQKMTDKSHKETINNNPRLKRKLIKKGR